MSERKNYPVKYVTDLASTLGKVPPQATDVEEAVLGAIMCEKNAIIDVASVLRKEMFYKEQHATIYEAIQQLFSEANPIDMRTVVARLKKNGKLELVGGAYYIAELVSKVSSAANIAYHSAILVEMAMKREMIQMASEVHQDSYEDTSDVFEIVAKTNLRLQEIQDHAISAKGDKSIVDICYALSNEIKSRQSGVTMGVPSGFLEVDRILNGFVRTHLIIIAARPGMGKTSFAMQAGVNVAKAGNPVGVFSLEMGDLELVERISASEAEIDSEKIKKGILDRYEQDRLNEFIGKIASLPLHIDDSPFLTIIELRARAMRMKTKYGIKLLIIDYLQLIKGVNETGRQITRDQEIGSITRTLKGIAKELDIPVIALSQLSRSVETRGGVKRPQLSDLRESGSIEQEADVVMFLYRPEYYKITQDEDGYSTHGLCEAIIEKHRAGSTGTAKQKFIGKYTKFTEWISDSTPMTTTKRQEFGTSRYKDPTSELPKDDFETPF